MVYKLHFNKVVKKIKRGEGGRGREKAKMTSGGQEWRWGWTDVVGAARGCPARPSGHPRCREWWLMKALS